MTRTQEFDRLVLAEVSSLRRYALALTRRREDADDLVQETLAKAIQAADRYYGDRDLGAWLRTIMHNTFISDRRRAGVRGRTEISMEADGMRPPSQEDSVSVGVVLRSLDHLPESQRQAVMLAAIDGLSFSEAAELTGVPIGTFMSRLGRGREALRRLLAGETVAAMRVIKGGRP